MTSPHTNQTPSGASITTGGGFTPRPFSHGDEGGEPFSPGLQHLLHGTDFTSSDSEEDGQEEEEQEQKVTYAPIRSYKSILETEILKVPVSTGDYLLDATNTLEDALLTACRLPSSDEFIALMVANPGSSLITAAGQSRLQDNHGHATLLAQLLQEQIKTFTADREMQKDQLASKEEHLVSFEDKIAVAEAKIELRKRELCNEGNGKEPSFSLAACRSRLKNTDDKLEQSTHLLKIAELLALANNELFRAHKVLELRGTLPFSKLQDASELAAELNLDDDKVKDLTCRQYIGLVRLIFLLGYHFSMAYIKVGPADREPVYLHTETKKIECRRVLCLLLGIVRPSSSSTSAVKNSVNKRKRRSSIGTISKKVRPETLEELVQVSSQDEMLRAKNDPGSFFENLLAIQQKKLAEPAQEDSSGGTTPAAI